ncbi:MAG: molecular chaperone HtpG [Brachymonas sp.]
MTVQTHSFQAEVAQLLHLVTHSLYSNPDIFLRELISNASDAADKLRFEALNTPDLYEDQPTLEVRVSYDKAAKTITIADNGIGMSEQEAIEHLGTIAKSGTKDFMSRLTGDQKADAQLIGQFGVGFYSGFIVADTITVESRRAGLPPEQGVRWISGGAGDFKTETITRAQRGTSITLHLRADKLDYLNGYRLKGLIHQYSDHIGLPVLMPKEEWKEGENGQPGDMVQTGEWEQVNEASALWTRPKKDISPEQYKAFYQELAHDYAEPLAWSHNKVEGNTEYTQLLYVPSKAPFDLYQRDHKHGLRLYVRRVFIMDDAEALLPQYLRFVKGIVDAGDPPLNVSRELLQESRDVKTIREGNTRRVLSMIEDMAKAATASTGTAVEETPAPAEGEPKDTTSEADTFARFYAEFGTVLKEGLGEDPANRERIAKLLRFASTTTDSTSVSLSDYKARMKEGQEAIYYITADTLAAARNSPQLELFRKKGIEVLLMADRVDEWALGFLPEFDGTPLQSVAKGAVDLGKLQDEDEKKTVEAAQESAKPLLDALKRVLQDEAEDVRVTTRLVDSAACLVSQEHGMSTQLARLLKQAGQSVPDIKPVLEINLEHPLIARLQAVQDDETRFADLAHVVFDQALLAEGGLPDDPAAYVRRVNALLA